MNEYISEAIQYLRIIGRGVLADEVEDLHKAASTLAVEKAEQAAAIRALQARCEAAEKDAERYRWVREYDNGSGVSCGISEEVADKGWERVGWLYEDELDAAIDAAIRPTESGKGE